MTSKDAMRIRAWLVLAAAFAFALAPFVFPGFDGYPAQAFPVPQYEPPIQPAGWAFAIWGPIYLWLLFSGAAGISSRPLRPEWDAVRLPLIASLVIGIAWLPMATVAPVLATVMIWAMLGAALVALRRCPASDRWLLRAPVAVYAGWLTAAAFVALGTVLGGYGIGSGGTVAAVLLPLAALLAGAVQWRLGRGVAEYGVAFGWALIGVLAASLGRGDSTSAVIAAAGLALIAVAIRRAPPREG